MFTELGEWVKLRYYDRYGRHVDSLRISVTTRCNLNCVFCHREGITGSRDELLTAEDYGFIAKVASELEIYYHKLTGGEPLIREDIGDIVKYMKEYSKSVSITTNGVFLEKRAKTLADAGVDYLNVSLHSLNPIVYSYITGGSSPKLLAHVLKGIEEALNLGLKIKINFLVMKVNIDQFREILNYASARGIDVNVIELIPLGTPPQVYVTEHTSVDPLISFLEEVSVEKHVREFQNRPVYTMPNGIKVTVIKGYGNPLLCAKCSRLRLTPDGKLKTCLFIEEPSVDILIYVKNRDEKGLHDAFVKAIMLRRPFFISGDSYGSKNG